MNEYTTISIFFKGRILQEITLNGKRKIKDIEFKIDYKKM